jgi:hypothetical protein
MFPDIGKRTEEEEGIKRRGGGLCEYAVKGTAFTVVWERAVFAAVKVRMQCPLIVPVAVGLTQGKAIESEEASEMGSEAWGYAEPESS